MKTTSVLFCLACIISTSTFGGVSRDSTLSTGHKKKLVRVYRAPKDWVLLELYKPGSIHLLQKTTVLGSMTLETDGVRFTPTTKSPEGYLPQEEFDRYYWYNSIMKEVFLPFSQIKSVNSHYGTIRTKDGKKYKFYCKSFRDRFGSKIRSKIKQ
jgi:hypothetical protein